MGALTINRNKRDAQLQYSPPYVFGYEHPHISKKLKSSIWTASSSMTTTKSSVSRLSLYPKQVTPISREIHAPCVFVKGFTSNFSGRKTDNCGDKMGNILVSKMKDAIKATISTCRLVNFEMENEVTDVNENDNDGSGDSGVEEVVMVESENYDINKSGELQKIRAKYRELDVKFEERKGFQASTSSGVVSDLIDENKLESLSLNRDVDAGVPYHKRLLNDSAKKHDSQLSRLNFEIELLQQKRASYQQLHSVKKHDIDEDMLIEPFRKLTDDEEELVANALSNSRRRKVLVTHEDSNIEITGDILRCLRPGAWLNDEVINVYLELLKEREKKEPEKFLKCHFFTTFFYKKVRACEASVFPVNSLSPPPHHESIRNQAKKNTAFLFFLLSFALNLFKSIYQTMERARRLANKAIIGRLVSQTKHNPSSLALYSPSRYVSSLSPYVCSGTYVRSDRNINGFGSQVRSISIDALKPSDTFPRRHNSATPDEQTKMAESVGFSNIDSLIDATVPKSIRLESMKYSKFDEGLTESQMIAHMQDLASKNKLFKSFIGMGYYNTYVPPVILRNIMENPGWYTQYTPYQAEIAQGRLESLLNFQTMVTDLTGLPMSNASLLDEGTAAAEAMAMCNNIQKGKKKTFIIASNCHPQTIDICKTRADGFDLKVITSDLKDFDYSSSDVCGVLVQYPGTEGELLDYSEFIKNAHANGVKVVMASDLLALTVLKPPGEFGADIVVGSAQRFGVPMGYGGPHAAFLATSQEYKRMMPGRIIGVSVDSSGKPALRMAMQTREQHIRRDKATSNICTAQALLANMAGMFGVYHGPEGLNAIAQRVHGLAATFAAGLKKLGTVQVQDLPFFDTVKITCADSKAIAQEANKHKMNLRILDKNTVTVAFDETTTIEDVDTLFKVFALGKPVTFTAASVAPEVQDTIPSALVRETPYLTHPIFNSYHTEHDLLRYISKLQSKDLSLCHSMIPLGSCTMKLNATTEMMPVTWPAFADMHPFAPTEQARGYQEMFENLGDLLCTITGFDSFSLQPNAGAAGEYAGLMVIRAYHMARGDHHRNVCIIPVSAHGTNPASAAMCGMKIITVGTDSKGNINIEEVRKAAEANKENLSALMVTYPSTHGVYEEGIDEICKIIHDNGGQVYMDGANMNAQVGLTSPGWIGADVCHLNLHKTFCIPHGGGGPGMGPIGVKKHLAPYLPSHPVVATGGIPAPENSQPLGTISAAPWGSALILPISYMYIAMMGSQGITNASKIAILNANYMAKRLESHYPILFRGVNGTVAHEFIVDLRPLKTTAGVDPEDVAKRLIDYGFHGPTMSWPVPGTLMIEPTESESKAELDRFCDALISIRDEIAEIEKGKVDINNNVIKGAPHPPHLLMADKWTKPYSREYAAYPAPWLRAAKFWPTTCRVDNVYGDRNLICTLQPPQEYEEKAEATA